MQVFKVNEAEEQRLDQFLSAKVGGYTRSAIAKLVSAGKVSVNGNLARSSQKLKTGDEVELDFDIDKQKQVADIDLPIIYEDDNVIVIDKPEGVLTHSKGVFNSEPTVASFIAPKLKDMEGERAGIVHRLDRGTSGVIICAKNQSTLKFLQKQFQYRKAKKTYLSVVEGSPKENEAIIQGSIERNPKKPQTFKIGANGKYAETSYRVLDFKDGKSLLELKPVTGRTHQLRVHLASIGHPIIGDVLYGGKPSSRMLLHAKSLEITIPGGDRKIFETKTPQELNL